MNKAQVKHEKFEVFKEDFALFIEAGFIAVKQLDEISALRIFEAAQILNPASSAPKIGFGYIALNKLEIKKASEIFEEICAEDPDNHLAQTFLGISYLLNKNKRKKGEKLIQEAIEKTTDPSVKNLGKTALNWSEKELSKIKSPFFHQEEPEEGNS